MKTTHTQSLQLYKKNFQDRLKTIVSAVNLTNNEEKALSGIDGLSIDQADNMIENVVGIHSLPFGIGTNFVINKKEYLIPMVIEEPSVVAAVSYAAKLFKVSGGFTTSSDDPIMIGQIQLLDVPNISLAENIIIEKKAALIKAANTMSSKITELGGGAKDIEVRVIDTSIGKMLIIHILYDTRDAMGANIINTVVEHLAPIIEEMTGGRANLRILSNLSDQRKARAEGTIQQNSLQKDHLSGHEIIKSILEASAFAEADPYRATTHNKGIMNGIDSVVLATGNDWRAIEAGAHSYAARGGSYTSLTKWWQDEDGNLKGSIELPLALGIVGGATRVHPTAQVALKILGIKSAQELAEVCAAVGLAQNFAAIRALATEGIQHGHMRMHAKQFATAAGAVGEEVAYVVQKMIQENNIRLQRAEQIIQEMRQGTDK